MTASVLVVDDVEDVALVMAAGLQAVGFVVTWTTDAERALGLIHDGHYSVLVTDVRMPRMNGRELAERARTIRPGLPIVFVTGNAGDILDQPFIEAIGARVLLKPFPPTALSRVVAAALKPVEHRA